MTSATHPATSLAADCALELNALLHIAFYKFVTLTDPDAVVIQLRALTRRLSGSILVAEEGINGVLAGTASELDLFEQPLPGSRYTTSPRLSPWASKTPAQSSTRVNRRRASAPKNGAS